METATGTGICAGDVKAQARDFGADLVGICSCAGFEKALPGCKPENLVKDARSVVVYNSSLTFGKILGYESSHPRHVGSAAL